MKTRLQELYVFFGSVIKTNSDTRENTKSHIQDTMHAQEPKASVHKRMTHSVPPFALHFKAGDSHARVNYVRGLQLYLITNFETLFFFAVHMHYNSIIIIHKTGNL